MTYTLASAGTSNLPSSFSGYTSPTGTIYIDTTASQQIYADGEISPGLLDNAVPLDSNKITSALPRHGENTASPFYLPPISLVIPYGASYPKLLGNTPSDFNSIGYISTANSYYSLDNLWFIDAMNSIIKSNSALSSTASTFGLDISTFQTSVYLNIIQMSQTPTADFLPGVYYFGSSQNLSTLKAGGNGNVFIFCNGDLNLDSFVSNAGSKLIIIADGNITFSSSNWCPANVAGNVLFLCSGNFVYNPSSSPQGQANLIIGAIGIISDGSLTKASNSLYYFASGQQATSTIPSPVPVQESANIVARFPAHTSFGDTPTLAGSPLRLSGTISSYNFSYPIWYSMQSNTGINDILSLLGGLANQFMYQYGVSIGLEGLLHKSQVPKIISNFDGFTFETYIAIQQSASSMPNVGIHTEPFDFQDYMTISDGNSNISIAQSYRVDDTHYTFYKAGYCLSCAPNGDITPNGLQITIPPTPYDLTDLNGTISITSACVISLSDPFPGGSPSTQGGMDAYQSINADNSSWQSTYRTLSKAPTTSLSPVIKIRSYYDSIINYTPFNGFSSDPNASQGILTIKNNTDRRSKIVVIDTTIRASSATSNSPQVGNIPSHYYHSDSTTPLITCATSKLIHFVLDNNFYALNANSQINVGADIYSYQISNASAVVNGILSKNRIAIKTIALSPESTIDIPVRLMIFFGDMIDDDTQYQLSTNGLEYFNRTIDGVFSNYLSKHIYYSDTTFDSTYRKPSDIPLLVSAGFFPPINGLMSRITRASTPLVNSAFDLVIDGCVKIIYLRGAIQVAIDLPDGIYSGLGGKNVVVSNGLIAVSDLPVSNGLITYYGFEDITQTISEGFGSPSPVQISNSDFAKAVLAMKNPIFIANDGLDISTSVVSGKTEFVGASFSTGANFANVVVRDGVVVQNYAVMPDVSSGEITMNIVGQSSVLDNGNEFSTAIPQY